MTITEKLLEGFEPKKDSNTAKNEDKKTEDTKTDDEKNEDKK